MVFFLIESLMFGVPDQKGRVHPDFPKEILSLNVALIFDPIPPVCFDGPKYDGILAEQHF
jgi:hypothetical protein